MRRRVEPGPSHPLQPPSRNLLIEGMALAADQGRLSVGFVTGVTPHLLVAEVGIKATGVYRRLLGKLIIAAVTALAPLHGYRFFGDGRTMAIVAAYPLQGMSMIQMVRGPPRFVVRHQLSHLFLPDLHPRDLQIIGPEVARRIDQMAGPAITREARGRVVFEMGDPFQGGRQALGGMAALAVFYRLLL